MPETCERVALCLMGPTATGKTELALRLAQSLAVEVVSVDSALVYRGMDIGTAKPSREVRQEVPHHLIDVVDPSESYSAGRFRDDALAAMQDIAARGRLPLLAGGTGLYFRALRQGLSSLPTADPELRARLDAEAAEHGWPALHRRLSQVDPDAAARIRPQDGQRIQRALEVYESSGRSLSEWQRLTAVRPPTGWKFLTVALIPADRKRLTDGITERFRGMMERGLLAEVTRVYRLPGVHRQSPAMRAVGYRQLARFLDGEIDLPQAQEQAVVATRQLAKRQLTWLRQEPVDLRLDPFAQDAAAAVLAWLRQSRARREQAVPVLESTQVSEKKLSAPGGEKINN